MPVTPNESTSLLITTQEGSALEPDFCLTILIHPAPGLAQKAASSTTRHQRKEVVYVQGPPYIRNTHLNTCLTLSTAGCSCHQQLTGTRVTDPGGDTHLPSHTHSGAYGPHIHQWVESPTPLRRFVEDVELNSCDALYGAMSLQCTTLSSTSLLLPHKQLAQPLALPDLPSFPLKRLMFPKTLSWHSSLAH